MKSRIRRYRGESVTVAYDIPRCIHAAVCVKRLPAVFDPARRPWILPDRADADELAETVAACPTGALQVERADGADGAGPVGAGTSGAGEHAERPARRSALYAGRTPGRCRR